MPEHKWCTTLFSTPTERLGPKAGTHPVHDPSHGFGRDDFEDGVRVVVPALDYWW